VAGGAGASESARRDRLTARRKALGLTQRQLAERLDVDRTTVARWERGEAEPLAWLWPKLASALRVSPDRIRELLAGHVAETTASAGGRVAAVPRQLPAAVADFTGRAAELAALTRMLDAADAGKPGTVVISAIGGTPGAGKTALALHWAHRAVDRFPDGQLHVNLRGFDPTGTPTTPPEAIRGFLEALSVPPERIPADPEAQAGLYRSLLASRRVLVMLDNARDEQQVRPLLPASPGSLVLVTSRNQLAGLAAAEGARLISLDVLSHEEAVRLLTARLGTARAAAEPGAVDEIVGLCARLPLALAVVAARPVARTGFPLAALAAELSKSADRLDILDAGDPAASVQAVFSWSYRQLSSNTARMFRLLGIHPGPDITVPAAASLAAMAKPEAQRLLRELARAHLIAERVPGRFAFHDLLRAYAARQAEAVDTQPERDAAIGRALDHYLHTGYMGTLLLTPSRDLINLASPGPGVTAETLASYARAMAWFEAEQQVLLAAIVLAAETGFDVHAWQIPWTMAGFFNRRGRWQEWAVSQRTAVAAATRLGDTASQALSRRSLASACRGLGEYDQALSHLKNCIGLYRQLGDQVGEARVHQSLGTLAEIQSRSADALGHHERSLRLFQAAGHQIGQAEELNNVGWSHALLGDYRPARAFCQQSLTLSSDIGHRDYEANSWDSLGYIEHQLGNLAQAAACYQRALGLFRELGDRRPEAVALAHLGDTCQAAGEVVQAREAWERALVIFEDLEHPDAARVRVKLASAEAR
jgi:tetratricopeptide (TPR) repeat protein/transcriptional regulator with XRE-family HTH domain